MANGEGGGNGNGNGRERLDSWKAISAYLGRDEATLRRWETSRGLPIRRLPGKRGASVYAYRDEIDAWLLTGQGAHPGSTESRQPTPPQLPPATVAPPTPIRSHRMRWAAALGAVILTGSAVIYLAQRGLALGEGILVDVSESAVSARDEDNRTRWTYSYEDTHRHVLSQLNESARISWRSPATIFAASAVRYRRSDNQVEGGRLTALDTSGRLKWRFEFEDAVTVGGRAYEGPWGVDGFAIDDSDESRRVAVAAHHYTWSPSIVAVLDDSGRRVMRYVNDGWIERVHWLPGSRLAVSGYSQAREGGMIALLDTSRADAQAPEDGVHRCSNCGGDQPLRVVVLPRSEVNVATASRFNRGLADLIRGELVVRTEEVPDSGQGPAEALYEFDANLTLLRASYSDRYWQLHDQLFRAKMLDHDRDQCPDRDGPRAYQSWSADAGWSTVAIR